MTWRSGGGTSLGALLLLAACPADTEPREDDGAGPTTLLPTASASDDASTDTPTTTGPGPTGSGSAGSGSTTHDSADTIDPPKLDVSEMPDFVAPDTGCRKVDFLFVIDNSGSMSAQQGQLLASFGGFIQAIQDSLQDSVDSYHVGVVTSDAYTANAPGCMAIGDLVTQTQAGGNCAPFAAGGRFATEMDDLDVKFPCMAQVGTFGSGLEMPVTASIAALGPAHDLPGSCNEGFLRDDAILVLVILTDDPPHDGSNDDAHPLADTSGWHQAIIDAKNGDPEAMVVIGFVPYMDVSCVVFTIESPNLIGFVESFGDQGVLASICDPDFGPAFADTVATIVTTCENFDPPG